MSTARVDRPVDRIVAAAGRPRRTGGGAAAVADRLDGATADLVPIAIRKTHLGEPRLLAEEGLPGPMHVNGERR